MTSFMSEEKKKKNHARLGQLLVQRLLEHKGQMYLYATVLEAPKLGRQVCNNAESTSHRAAESKSATQSALSYCLGGGLSFHWQ